MVKFASWSPANKKLGFDKGKAREIAQSALKDKISDKRLALSLAPTLLIIQRKKLVNKVGIGLILDDAGEVRTNHCGDCRSNME